ncbi:MAG: twin-arginine translocase subunit TatC [Anaerolineae bacterium]|nr:twin-arginine translocase subunit TatC [Anaerolineae bacterium]
MPRLRLPGRSREATLPPEPPEIDTEEQIEDEDGNGARMGLFEHLDELRYRLVRAAGALVIGTIIGVIFAAPALEFLTRPYCEAVEENIIVEANPENPDADATVLVDSRDCRLVSLGPTGAVVAYFRVSLLLGAIIAIPIITYQLLMFILPGLTRKEKRIVLSSIPAVTALFLIGVAFSWFVLMRPALGFLEGFQPTLFRPEWTSDLYLSFVTSLIFWMGVAFETPLVFFVLGLIGVVSVGPLIHNWRIAVIAASIAAALITPTIDPVNMMLVMGPLMVLYLLSILLVFIARRIARIETTEY